jgi:hypothetical protein
MDRNVADILRNYSALNFIIHNLYLDAWYRLFFSTYSFIFLFITEVQSHLLEGNWTTSKSSLSAAVVRHLYKHDWTTWWKHLTSNSVPTKTALRTRRCGSNPDRGRRFFLISITCKPALEPTQPPIQWAPGFFTGRKSGLRLGMCAAAPLFPLYALMAWTGTTLALPFLQARHLLRHW